MFILEARPPDFIINRLHLIFGEGPRLEEILKLNLQYSHTD